MEGSKLPRILSKEETGLIGTCGGCQEVSVSSCLMRSSGPVQLQAKWTAGSSMFVTLDTYVNDGWYRGKCMCWVHMLTWAQTKTPGSHTSRRKESKNEMRCSVTHTLKRTEAFLLFKRYLRFDALPHSDGNITAATCVEDATTMPYYTKNGTYIKRNWDHLQKSLLNRLQMIKRRAGENGVRWAMFCPLGLWIKK